MQTARNSFRAFCLPFFVLAGKLYEAFGKEAARLDHIVTHEEDGKRLRDISNLKSMLAEILLTVISHKSPTLYIFLSEKYGKKAVFHIILSFFILSRLLFF